MANNDNLRKPDENDIRPQFEDERTQARIQEHLTNEDDIITEQDIANIQVGAGASQQDVDGIVAREETIMDNLDIKKDSNNDDWSDDPAIETPWNVLQH